MKNNNQYKYFELSDHCFLFRGGSLNNNSVVFITKKSVFIIDPSFNLTKIREFLSNNSLDKIVIFTHAHTDHIGDHFHDVVAYADKIIFSALAQGLIDDKCFSNLFFGNIDNIHDDELKKFIFIKNSEKFQECTFYLTPGHSIDSMCIHFNNFLLTGDLLFVDGIGRTDLVHSNPSAMIDSINFITRVLMNNPDLIIIPGHEDFDSAKNILLNNPDLVS